MAVQMQARIGELQKHWQKNGVSKGLHVRMGISTGYCTVGNFGSEQRLDYTVLGRPVNMAARLEALAKPDTILIDETTHNLLNGSINCHPAKTVSLKGFSRPVEVFEVDNFALDEKLSHRRHLTRSGEHVEVSIHNSSDIQAAILELRQIQEEFEKEYRQELDGQS